MTHNSLLSLALLASAASLSFAVPAWAAETVDLPTEPDSSDSPQASGGVIEAADYAIAEGQSQGWFAPVGNDGGANSATISFEEETTFSGKGLIGISFKQGSGDTVETVDLTNVDASSFSGQLIVINEWDNETDVKLSGSSWADVEFLFGNAVDDTELAAKYGLTDTGLTRGDLNNSLGGKGLNDYLALQGDTTLAGVTGATKGTTGTGTASSTVLCDHEFITVASNGDTLTIAGSGEYAFYGTAGTSSARMSLAMTGSGSQTFGGTNYLQDVTVTAGTLALGGTTSIAGSVTVAANSTLALSGEVTLAETIQNSGTVTIDSSTVFILDELTATSGSLSSGEATYTLISGGTITGWDGLGGMSNVSSSDYTITGATFTVDGSALLVTVTTTGELLDGLHGTGSVSNPYFTSGTSTVIIPTSIFTGAGTTVYLATDEQSLGTASMQIYWSGAFTAECDIVIGAAGVYITDGSGGQSHTFSGAISGEGDFTVTHNGSQGQSVNQDYTFTGDLSQWSGNFTIETSNTSDYVYFGNGGTAATNTAISGTGAIAVDYGTVRYNYATGASGSTEETLTVENTYIEGHTIEFAGSVSYDVSSDLIGVDAGGATNSTLKISTTGTVTVSGSISNFDSVVVGASSTLTLSGDVSLSDAIQNSGTVKVTNTVTFELGNLTADGNGVYTIISGGTITNWNSETLTSANFTLDGWDLGRSTVDVTTEGQVTVTTVAAESLIWAGDDGATWSNRGVNWVDSSNNAETFYNRDSVTFGTYTSSGGESKTVNISTSLLAGTIIVSDNYTFVFADGIKVEASYVDIASGKTLTLQMSEGTGSAEFHMDSENFYQFLTGSGENHGNLVIGAGVTFYLSDLNDSASFDSNNTGVSITGTGTLSVGATGGIGLYLPSFEGTVEFRSGTVRFASDTGIYSSQATLVFDEGAGLQLTGNLTNAVSASLVFAEGSHTIASGTATGEFSGAIDAADATITITGTGKLTFSGGGTIGTLQLGSAATTVLTGDTTYTIGTIAATAHANSTLEISEKTTVNAESLTANWHFETMKVDGVLNISGTAVFGTASVDTYVEHFTGSGTVTIGTLQVGHSTNSNGASIKIEGGITFIVGEVTSGGGPNHYLEIGNATIGASNASGITFGTDENKFVLSADSGESTTFNTSLYDVEAGAFTDTGTTITIATVVSGTGAMTVTGNGSLVLSGENTYSGGTTIKEGVLIAQNSSALGSGAVYIDGGQLEISGSVTITNSVSVTLSNTYLVSDPVSPASLGSGTLEPYAAGDGIYAITGTGSLGLSGSEVTITLFIDETIAELLANAGETGLGFYLLDAENITATYETTFTVSLDEALSSYTATYDTETGIVWIVGAAAPEPELFSVFFGIATLGLISTRRRRRRKVA